MKLHPRTIIVQKASAELGMSILAIAKAHDLTALELIGILAQQISTTTKFALRHERHPDDPDIPADSQN